MDVQEGGYPPPFFVCGRPMDFHPHIPTSHVLETQRILSPIRETLDRFEATFRRMIADDPYLNPLFQKAPNLLGGKRIRPILFFLCHGMAGAWHEEALDVASLVELLHLASLIHDDVVDGSSERRGAPSLNQQWGDGLSILAGDYLMARVLLLAHRKWAVVHRILLETIASMTRGELRQTLVKGAKPPSVSHYFEIVGDKTASLFAATAELGGVMAGGDHETLTRLRRIGHHFGMAFQIRDDILDYDGSAVRMGKPVGRDFMDGLFTLPAILAFSSAGDHARSRFLAAFQTPDAAQWAWVRTFVVEYRGIEGALQEARRFTEEAITLIKDFPPSPYRETLDHLVSLEIGREG